jgi:2-hydroxy-6-oxonona-2,4-dienedioate hydrolase
MPLPPSVSTPTDGAFPSQIQSSDQLVELEQRATRSALRINGGDFVLRHWPAAKNSRPFQAPRPIVLLHGGSGAWNHFARNIAALVTSGRDVWVPDLPGFGESSAPTVGQDADVLPEPLGQALDQLLGDREIDILGFSFGSMVAALLAQNRPAQIKGLYLVGSPALGVNAKRPFKLRPWLDVESGPQRDVIHRHNLGVLMFHRQERVDDLAVAIHGMNLARDRMHKRRLAYSDLLLRTLQSIDTPVFGIWGAEDVLYRDSRDALVRALQQARHLRAIQFIEDAGHWVQYEAHERFNAVLLEALNS